jgi:hypothetical protein
MYMFPNENDDDNEPDLVQVMSDQAIGVPTVPEAPDVSGFNVSQPTNTPTEAPVSVAQSSDIPRVHTLEEAEQVVNEGAEPTAPSSTNAVVHSLDEADQAIGEHHTVEDLYTDPDKLKVIRDYMTARLGDQWEDRDPKETVDTFMRHMRWSNSNDISLIAELRNVGESDEEAKSKIANAYNLYDDLSSFLTNNGAMGAVGATKDYVLSTLASPTTYVGGIIGGKIASKVLGGIAKEQLLHQAMRGAIRMGKPEIAKELAASYAKRRAIIAATAGAATDLPLNLALDVASQETRIEAGSQEGYDPLELGLAGAGSVLGGLAGYIPQAVRKNSKLGKARFAIDYSQNQRAKNAASVAGPKVATSLKNSVNKMAQQMTDWKRAVAEGENINPELKNMSDLTSWFFDKDNPDSLFRIVHDAGAKIDLDDDGNFTSQLIDYARKLPSKDIADIDKTLAPMGVNFGDMLDIVAATQSQSGAAMSRASQAKIFAQNVAKKAAANAYLNTSIVKGVQQSLTNKPLKFEGHSAPRYLASLWRRMLISNPATSFINVQGWGQAYLARSFAEALHGGVLGTAGLVEKMVNGKYAGKHLGQSKALFQNQIFKLRSLLDPYSTIDAFNAMVSHASQDTKEKVQQNIYGGIQSHHIPQSFGINPNNVAVKGAEKIADLAAKYTFVKAQDMLTKTFSGITELDLLSRTEYGKSLPDLINNGEYHLITDDMWKRALNVMAKDTFSADYTKGKGIAKLAQAVEDISNAPYIGFLFPFGRFMNNTIAFSTEYSPVGLLPIAGKIFSGNLSYDVTEKIAKAVTGTIALGTMFAYTREQQERGNAWWEHETSGGTIINQQNLAPISLFRITARIGDLVINGDPVPREMWKEFVDQLGVGQWSKELGSNNALSDVAGYFSSSDPADAASVTGFLSWMTKQLTGVAAGFTRPLDPINKMVGAATTGDVTVDRRQAKSGLDQITQELTRYTNNIFAPLFGEGKTEEGAPVFGTPLRSATGPAGDIRDPNPVGTILSIKTEPAKTPIEKLLGQVNIPTYVFQSRTASPEFDRFMNEHILPVLNYKARTLMRGAAWQHMKQYEKEAAVRDILTSARDEIINDLNKGFIGDEETRKNNSIRIWSTLPQSSRTAAREHFNITKPDRDLTAMDIEVMRHYIKQYDAVMKNVRGEY